MKKIITKELPVIGVKIIEEKYASDFIDKGVIHFSQPSVWRDSTQCSGNQLDKDEGCFCSSINPIDSYIRNRSFKREKDNNLYKYYENNEMIVGTCFYGIERNGFKEGITKYGVKLVSSKNFKVSLEYFKKFYEQIKDNVKTIIIFDMWKFYELLIEKIIEMGAKREEIYLSKVSYVNKSDQFYIKDNFPIEYFYKDNKFSEQNELRIMIASKNKSFYDNLEKNNNNIIIGDISSFTRIENKYEEDLEFTIEGKKLIYKTATPIIKELKDLPFNELVILLYQGMQNHFPGEPMNNEEKMRHANCFEKILREEFGVIFNKDDWRLYEVPYKEYLTLPELYKGMCLSLKFANFEELKEFENKNKDH